MFLTDYGPGLGYITAKKFNLPQFWTPAKLGSALALWIDPSDASSVTLNGANVSQINDKSGKGNHLSQSLSANQPQYVIGGLNGLNIINNQGGRVLSNTNPQDFFRNVDGASWMMVGQYPVGATYGGSAMMAFCSTGLSTGATRLGLSPALAGSPNQGLSGRRLDSDTFQVAPSTTPRIVGVPQIAVAYANYQNGVANHWTNGTQDLTNATFQTPGLTSDTQPVIVSVFNSAVGGTLNTPPGTQLAEVLALNGQLSTEDRQKVEGYLAWKWGMVASLPANHPYKYDGSLFMWTPALAFKSADNGVWYDPSDFSTLFQDSLGKTPVTAVEQPVGLMMDKSKGYGTNNLPTLDFSQSVWSKRGEITSPSIGVIQYPSGTTGGGVYTVGAFPNNTDYFYIEYEGTSDVGHQLLNEVLSVGPNTSNTIVELPAGPFSFKGVWKRPSTTTGIRIRILNYGTVNITNFRVRVWNGNHAIQATATSRPILRARYNLLTATETLATQSTTTVATTYRLLFTGAGTITLSGTATGTYSAGTHNITCTAGTLTLTVSGSVTRADLRPTDDTLNQPPYQRVTTSTDYDTVGFMPYLQTDGVDDWMSTSNINFTGTDKVTVVAGLRKNVDTTSMFLELSTTVSDNPGSFAFVTSPTGTTTSNSYGFRSRGTATASVLNVEPFVAPITNVVTCIGDISGDTNIIRVNAIQRGINNTDQGTGNYGNYPLFLFRRAGIILPLNGRMYGLVIINKLLSTGDLTKLETFINNETKAY